MDYDLFSLFYDPALERLYAPFREQAAERSRERGQTLPRAARHVEHEVRRFDRESLGCLLPKRSVEAFERGVV
ncbi:MAG: hypothetical protein AAF211_04535, partial [Myxococcota bacterium]